MDQLTNCNDLAANSLPACSASALADLFPPHVVVRERRAPGDAQDLLPAEAAYVARAVPKRINEFAAGRACARAALAGLGIHGFALHAAGDRQPLWPEGVVGSITHTTGFCAAAVAARTNLLALGLDTELVGAPTLDIWATICRREELDWVAGLSRDERPAAVTLLFSAKEAFYKCQHPLVGEWLDFHDLGVEIRDWGRKDGRFEVRASRALRVERHAQWPIEGRYAFHQQFVSAVVVLANPQEPV